MPLTWQRVQRASLAVGIICLPASQGWGERIQLKNRTTITADVLRVEDDRVILSLPRGSVTAVDGTPLPPPLAEGTPAPEFSVVDVAGKPQRVGKDQGAVTLLHFWVQWCPHCRSDAPKIQALYDAYRENPRVKVVTVNLDRQRADLDAFIRQRQVTYPVISAAEQARAAKPVDLTGLYQISGFPMTYVIDAQGIIRHKFSGSFAESGKDVRALIAEMIASPRASATDSAQRP